MACVLKNQRLQAILDVINSAVKTGGIKNYGELRTFFSENFPEVDPVEMHQALVPTDSIRRADLKDQLQTTRSRLQRLTNATNRLNSIMDATAKGPKKRPTDPEVKEIADIIKDIRNLAAIDLGSDIAYPSEVYGDLISRLENMMILHDAYFDLEGPVAESHVQRAVEHARQIRKQMKLDRLDEKIKDLDEQIKGLEEGSIDISQMETLGINVQFKGLDKTIARKELELQAKRKDLDMALAKAKRKALASKGFLGFDNPGAQKITEMALLFKDNAWEPWRAIKFMGDISAWGVQAAPSVYAMMTDVRLKDAFRGDFASAFESQIALGNIFKATVIDVLRDGARNSRKWGRYTTSTQAQELLNQIKKDSAYPMAVKAKLQISEAGSLNRGEEVFTSDLLNRVPWIGLVKDISEDTMTSTLNALRFHQFKRFYDATDGALSVEEYTKVAELLNKATGTSSDSGINAVSRYLSYILSAPKLMLSRLKLIAIEPWRAAGGVNVKQSLTQGKLAFKSEADRFKFFKMAEIIRGYALIPLLIGMINGIEFEEDPTDSNFGRYRVGNLAVDATGGIGSMYRALIKSLMIARGVPDWASYSTKDKYNYLTQVQRVDPLDPLLDGFLKYKLHPTISASLQLISGEDFFGEPYANLGTTGVLPHIEAAARAFLPISVETAVDDILDIYEGDISVADATVSSSLQFIGFNAFRYDNKMSDIRVQNFLNDMESRPRIQYPKVLQKPGSDKTKQHLRSKFRDIWANNLGDRILSKGADPNSISKSHLNAMNRAAIRQAEAEFKRQYPEAFD